MQRLLPDFSYEMLRATNFRAGLIEVTKGQGLEGRFGGLLSFLQLLFVTKHFLFDVQGTELEAKGNP